MSAYAGIDISKDALQVALHPQSENFVAPNTLDGVAQIISWFGSTQVERVLVEATGGYEKLVVRLLAKAGFNVLRINPVRAHQFARAMGKRAKTDPIDARMLAMFAATLAEPDFVVPDDERDKLTELVNQREAFIQQRDDNRRRIQQAHLPDVLDAYRELNDKLNTMIKVLDKRITAQSRLIDASLMQHLREVKGIGPVMIASLFCYLPELGDMSRSQVAALVGVAPYNNDSGSKRGIRRIYGGRSKLRRVVYMCVLTMVRYNEDFKTRYANLRARGKCAKVALVACMRVLVVRLNAMARDKTPWRDQPA